MKNLSLKSMIVLLAFIICHSTFAQKDTTLTVAILEKVFDTAKVKQKIIQINYKELPNMRFARIFLNNRSTVIRGKIISYNKHGLFVFRSCSNSNPNSQIGFYPFKELRKVKLGKSYGNFLRVTTTFVAGATSLIILPQDAKIAIPWGIISGVTYATFGQILVMPVYAAIKKADRLNWDLKQNKNSIQAFYTFLKNNPDELRNVGEFKENRILLDKKNETSNQDNETTNDSIQINTKAEQTNITPDMNENRKFLEGQVFGDDNQIHTNWIFLKFKSENVDEAILIKEFKNIKGITLNGGMLKKYNTSQLQFLSMMICSGSGYNMKEVKPLTQNQRTLLSKYETGNAKNVKKIGTISTMNLSDIDLDNIKLIFEELKLR